MSLQQTGMQQAINDLRTSKKAILSHNSFGVVWLDAKGIHLTKVLPNGEIDKDAAKAIPAKAYEISNNFIILKGDRVSKTPSSLYVASKPGSLIGMSTTTLAIQCGYQGHLEPIEILKLYSKTTLLLLKNRSGLTLVNKDSAMLNVTKYIPKGTLSNKIEVLYDGVGTYTLLYQEKVNGWDCSRSVLDFNYALTNIQRADNR